MKLKDLYEKIHKLTELRNRRSNLEWNFYNQSTRLNREEAQQKKLEIKELEMRIRDLEEEDV